MRYLFLLLLLSACSYNVDFVKNKSKERLAEAGYEIVAYEGFISFMSYCGGDVYYTIKRQDSPVLYSGMLCKWGNEIHLYNVKAISGNDIQLRNK